jgi:hypothetical protein
LSECELELAIVVVASLSVFDGIVLGVFEEGGEGEGVFHLVSCGLVEIVELGGGRVD